MTKVPDLNETQFTHQVVELAVLLGWQFVHFRPAQTRRGTWVTPVQGPLGKGWPDLFMIRTRDRRVLAAELKAQAGYASPEQTHVLAQLEAAGIETHVWRPRDIEQVAEVLR